ncbi:segregation and condensation protein A [alpha proteobacterium U9-1i]|nr:segregation and condensation protein A [alpha proteobacterium U9-1i]
MADDLEDQTELDLAAAAEAEGREAMVVALDVFEGPLYLLLDLARSKKVDLGKVSIGELADQYLAFIAEARAANIEVAGDYLVMAAWLALLKSRMLIPKPKLAEDEPDPDQLAAALRSKLMHIELARLAAKRLETMPQLGREFFLNGLPQQTVLSKQTVWKAELYDLLNAYCAERSKSVRKRAYKTTVRRAYPLETARRRLEEALTKLQDWRAIDLVTPAITEVGPEAPPQSSYLASTFGAALELAREGKMELRQAEAFAPLFVRAKTAQNDGP